ncbi:MAG: serine/threonine protein kinase [Polyangiaceae bacterium]|nr:serine/threonine protein kinase [Polyangiaceae bacterium]
MTSPADETREPTPADRIGTVIGQRYKVERVLGEGGIGAVFLAEDLQTHARVAVKLLKRDVANDPIVLARFEREAVAMQALAHDHIVAPLGYGQSPEGDMCLVMEHVDGETLRTMLKRVKQPPLWGTLEIARQLAAALVRAHGLGVVHRDLKPENVMVQWRGEGRPWIKVLDFGMARLLVGGPGTPLTRKGAVFGTPEYMPPEQAMGQPVDARADQYAYGVMLFELVAGTRPFKAKSPLEMLQKQIREAPPSLRELAPSTPVALEAAIVRMMAKKPDDRFPDVATAAAAVADAGR